MVLFIKYLHLFNWILIRGNIWHWYLISNHMYVKRVLDLLRVLDCVLLSPWEVCSRPSTILEPILRKGCGVNLFFIPFATWTTSIQLCREIIRMRRIRKPIRGDQKYTISCLHHCWNILSSQSEAPSYQR